MVRSPHESQTKSGRNRRRTAGHTCLKSSSFDVIGVKISSLKPRDLIQQIAGLFSSQTPHQVITGNALLAIESLGNPPLKEACDKATLVTGESAGISWAIKYLYKETFDRIAGVDLAYQLCEVTAQSGHSVYLLGGGKNVAESAAQNLKKEIPGIKIAGTRDGFFDSSEESAVINEIKKSGAKFILVALGMPKQDIWINTHLKKMPAGVCMGVGGTLDVWSGRITRAPGIMQTLGLEWLYRLIQEPWRWKRILLLPRFALLVLAQKSREI